MKYIPPNLQKIFVLIVVIFLWELSVTTGFIYSAVLPPPSAIIKTLGTLIGETNFWLNIITSLGRVVLAISLATFIGTFLGLSMGFFNLARIIFQPLIVVTQPIPKIMLYPIFIILFGFGELSRILYIFLGCLYIIVFAAYQGVINTDQTLLDAARSLGASRLKIFTQVVFPSSLPYVMGGLKSAIGLALILMFFSETIGTKTGLGYFVMLNWSWLNMSAVFSGIIVTSVIGVILIALIGLIENILLDWKKVR